MTERSFFEGFFDLGKFARLLVVCLPIGGALYTHEMANHDLLTAIQDDIKALRTTTSMDSKDADVRYTTLEGRVTVLEAHRDADVRDIATLSGKIEGLTAQSNETLSGVNDMRNWLLQRPIINHR